MQDTIAIKITVVGPKRVLVLQYSYIRGISPVPPNARIKKLSTYSVKAAHDDEPLQVFPSYPQTPHNAGVFSTNDPYPSGADAG